MSISRMIVAACAMCCMLGSGLLFAVVPTLAAGLPTTISATPSSTEPYYACPTAEPGGYKCEEIVEPAAYDRALSASGGAYPDEALGSAELEPAEEEKYGELEGLSPQNLWSAYKLTGKGGYGKTVAIVDAYNYPDAEADLNVYRKHYGLSACTRANECFEKINQKGESSASETSSIYPEASGTWSREMSLDLDMVSAICQECHIVLVEANGEGNELDAGETEAASLDPAAISDSWGRAEESAETSRDIYFDRPGIPVVVAGGDYGYRVRYPSASPYVISVGGTVLSKASNTRGWIEEVWPETGSGCSAYELEPRWQEEKTFPKACGKYRTTNDVAAVAYHLSAYDSYEAEGWRDATGTSAATPIIAGLEALSSSVARTLAADTFYKKPSMLFHISVGANGSCGAEGSETYYLCHATKEGYNGPTGWGTPDGVFTATAEPSVTTGSATGVTETEATLNGSVNPNGLETKYYFEYGTTDAYGSKTAEVSAGSGETSVEASKAVTGLEPGTIYEFRIVATNSEGTTDGKNQTVTTSGVDFPSVETEAATGAGETTAALNGTVDPRGAETKYFFDYGTTNSLGTDTPEASAGSGTSIVEESYKLTGLTPSTTYHYIIYASNRLGGDEGSEVVFSTTGKPTVETKGATSVGEAGATLTAIVNPRGFETKYYFEYGTTEAYGTKTTEASAGAGTGNIEVSKTITGLTAGKEYYFRIVATNSKGTAKGESGTFLYTVAKISEYLVENPAEVKQITSGPDGNLWFTSHDNPSTSSSTIGKITTSGTITEFALPKEADPEGITAGPEKEKALWFTDYHTSKIGKITTSGTITEYSLPEKSEPRRITVGPDGNLWFTDYRTSKIGKITPSGTIAEYALPSGSDPVGIIAGPDGNLWFADYGTNVVGKITTSGTITKYGSDPSPEAITVGPDGDLWVSGYNMTTIEKFTTSGARTEYPLPEGRRALTLTAGPEKESSLWFTGAEGTPMLGKITTTGKITEYLISMEDPWGITVGPDSKLWLTDRLSHKIGTLTPP
jgi:streptogramin lyase